MVYLFQKQGCPKCANNIKITFKEFVRRSNEKHNFAYTYNESFFTKFQQERCSVFSQALSHKLCFMYEDRNRIALEKTKLPETPNFKWVNNWLTDLLKTAIISGEI